MVLRLLALFLDRLGNMNHINKSTSCVQLPDDLQVLLPHWDPTATEVTWLKDTIQALTFHQGSGLRGHYRTSVRAHNLWWHYDDGAVPAKNFTC